MGNRIKTIIGVFAVAAIVAAAVYFIHFSKPLVLPEGLIQANGRIEGDRITVSGKFGGRLLELTVNEGEWVESGQILAHLDDSQVLAKVDQAREAWGAGCAQVRAHEAILAAMNAEVPIGVEAAQAAVDHAVAVVGKARAVEEQAQKDAERFRDLAARETVSRHELEKAELALQVSRQDLSSAKIGVIVARKQLAQAVLGYEKIKAKEEEVEANRAVCQQAQAVLAEANSVLNDLTIRAPCKGLVMEKIAHTGEVVAAGSPLFDLVNLDQLYLKAFIPEKTNRQGLFRPASHGVFRRISGPAPARQGLIHCVPGPVHSQGGANTGRKGQAGIRSQNSIGRKPEPPVHARPARGRGDPLEKGGSMGKAHMVNLPAVEVRDLKKSYGRTMAVDGVDFSVMPGEIYGLIGPDGAGKSSVMKTIAGVLSYDSGSVKVFGTELVSERTAETIKQRCGFMPQGLGLNLYPDLSIEENIDFFARLRLVPRAKLNETKSQLLSMTRLEPFRSRPMKKLSGGMKQKLGLVCTLIHEPDLIILDEPTTGVDPVSRRDFWKILSSLLREKGITAIVSTAYMDEASRFHHLCLFHQGKILARGDMESITENAGGSMVVFKCTRQKEALERLAGPPFLAQVSGPWIRAFSPLENTKATDQVLQALKDIPATETHTQKPNLEEVFIHLLGQKEDGKQDDPDEIIKHSRGDSMGHGGPLEVIQAAELVRKFGDFMAVDHVSFSVKKGEIFGLVGANGAGKTTVIKMLTGILPPSAGHGKVAGGDMKKAARFIKEHIGYVSQAFSLYQELTVRENLRLYGAIYGLSSLKVRSRAQELASMMGLNPYMEKRAGTLPMGLRQRLALGCALVHRPTILFLDEPTSGVDPLGRKRFWEILHQLSREDAVTILITTHYMSEVENCDHVVIMHAGKVVADDSPEQLKKNTETKAGELLEVHTDQPLRTMALLEAHGFEGVGLFGKNVHLLAKDPACAEKTIRALVAQSGALLYSIRPMALGMEDVFVCQVLSLEKAGKEAA